jgi:transposase
LHNCDIIEVTMNANESNIDYKDQLERANGTIAVLQQELAQLKKLIFGSRQERFVPATSTGQLSLDITSEPIAALELSKSRKIEYTRSSITAKPVSHPGRTKLPEHLRREEIVLEPDQLPAGSKKIGQEETEQLECVPAELYVKKYIRPKYLLPTNENELTSRVIIAPLPAQPIDKCIAGPGLLTHIIIEKYCDHLPLHRQLQRFERSGVKIPYSTVSEWLSATCRLIAPLYQALVKETFNASYLQADETPCAVLDKDKKGKTHRGFYWLYQDCINKLVVFDYQEGRNKEGPTAMLEGFNGTLQTDGFAVYDSIAEQKGITLIHCMAHARRYFVDALSTDKLRAEYALEQIQQLYAVERLCTEQDFNTDLRRHERIKTAVPILQQLGEWMISQYQQVLPKSPIGKALAYSIKRWDKLSAYAHNGILLPDNNKIENSVRPVALGRKNYLFAGSHEAARRSAMLYSLLGTCKLHSINPQTWLCDVITKIASHPISKINLLLPQYWIQQQK